VASSVDCRLHDPCSNPVASKIFCIIFLQVFRINFAQWFNWAVVGRLRFRDGVSASYSYFRRVCDFNISHTAAVWLSPALVKCVLHLG